MSSALEVGAVVDGRYRIEEVIGRGGFGVVYRATHVDLERTVALKLLLPHYSETDELVMRFIQEARSAAAIGHPGIVEVFDLGQQSGRAFLAMEMLDGEVLAERIAREHPLSETVVARIGAEIADAIAAAHDHGIVHRDLKPENVFLARRGRRSDVVKILDFGIAKLLHRSGANVTKTGQFFGTPRYSAPEQFRRATEVDHRADIYALGTVLFQTLTNQLPFDAETYPELVLKIISDRPPAIASFRPDVSPELVAIIERAMAKAKEDRWQSAHDLAGALEAHASSAPGNARRSSALLRPTADVRVANPATPDPAGAVSVTAEQRSRVAKVVIGAALVSTVALAMMGSWLLSRHGDEIAPVEHTEHEASNRPPEPSSPAREPIAEPAPPTPSPPEVQLHRVRFSTEPSGARVSVDGTFMCTTPCEALLTELPALAVAEREGYERSERLIQRGETEVGLSLSRRQYRRRGPRPSAPAAAPLEPVPPPLRPR